MKNPESGEGIIQINREACGDPERFAQGDSVYPSHNLPGDVCLLFSRWEDGYAIRPLETTA